MLMMLVTMQKKQMMIICTDIKERVKKIECGH